jgi:mRNA interferase YafQ
VALLIRQSTRFRQDVKRLQRQGADIPWLETLIDHLINQATLDDRYRDHPLVGNWRGYRECYVQPDRLLIYRIDAGELQLVRTGSHAELFG